MKLRLFSVAAVVSIAVATAAAGTAADGTSARTITAIGQATGFASVDADRDGKRTVGDYEIGQTAFLNEKTGKLLGRGSVICTMLDNGGTRFQCQGQNRFPGGEIVIAGLFSVTKKSYRLAIVGGTGSYAGVKGTVAGTWLDAKFLRQKVVFTFDS